MTLIACVSDSHFDHASRFEECVRLHDWIAADLERRHPDLICHAGDVFERKSTPEERLAVARWLRRLADIAPVLIVRGNHDVLGDLPIFARLRGRHPVHVEEAASVHVINGIAVAALAWPRKSEILAHVAGQAGDELAAEALRAVLRGLGDQLAQHEGPRLLLAHAMVRASRTSTGQPLVGCDFELGLEDLALARADAYLLGHIHLGQDWLVQHRNAGSLACDGGTNADGAPVIYPGSPRRTAYGETELKGYVHLGIDPDQCGCPLAFKRGACGSCENRGRVTWDRAYTPATPMFLLDYEWTADGMFCHDGAQLHEADLPPLESAEVRFRYRVASDQRDAARAAAAEIKAEWLALGAADVKVEEEVIAVNRARLPEVARMRTLADKLCALWRHRGNEPEPERRERLLAKAESLKGAA